MWGYQVGPPPGSPDALSTYTEWSAAMTAAAEGQATPRIGRAAQKSLLQSEAAQGWALISPTFLFALVLLVAPILVVIAHSFWTQNYLTIDRTFTLEQYRIALTE